ncbi:relaxase MobL [Enterococcus faecalis]|uniref:relaxase MobL n=1 Tax=Enterococcus faecalis TaxID=1351 RepID=UPI0023DBA3B2|nr:relaxase MobL [Enterococcus faecalis]
MASIHRNTKHIHFALVENRNTRDEKVVKINGEEFVQPKGIRKQSTLDAMKQAYGRELRDYALGNERVKKFERKSELRKRNCARNEAGNKLFKKRITFVK